MCEPRMHMVQRWLPWVPAFSVPLVSALINVDLNLSPRCHNWCCHVLRIHGTTPGLSFDNTLSWLTQQSIDTIPILWWFWEFGFVSTVRYLNPLCFVKGQEIHSLSIHCNSVCSLVIHGIQRSTPQIFFLFFWKWEYPGHPPTVVDALCLVKKL